MMRHRILPLLAALALVAGACGGGGGGDVADQDPAPRTPDVTGPTVATEPGQAETGPDGVPTGPSPTAPEDRRFAFEAPLVEGGTYDGTQLAGRDVAIWFWAPW